MNKWQEWSEKFLALTQREKIIIAGAIVFLAAYGMFYFVLGPQAYSKTQQKTHIEQLSSELLNTQSQIGIIKESLKQDPNERVKLEIKRLSLELIKINAQLDQVMTDYVAPELMAKELTSVLSTSDNVRVIGLTIEPPEKIELGVTESNSQDDLPEYFRHEFVVMVEGEYFNLMRFVKGVISKNKQFKVDGLRYEVQEHPSARMTLSLVTVSDSRNVIRL